ncbi:MAG: putative addiction module antidote protein [Chloroflexota bacterium]
MENFKKFDAADYLDSEEMIAEYLTAALEDENPDVFLAALADVAKARGMSAIAQSTGLGRESLYKALAPGAKPRYDTILKVLNGLGVKLTVTP